MAEFELKVGFLKRLFLHGFELWGNFFFFWVLCQQLYLNPFYPSLFCWRKIWEISKRLRPTRTLMQRNLPSRLRPSDRSTSSTVLMVSPYNFPINSVMYREGISCNCILNEQWEKLIWDALSSSHRLTTRSCQLNCHGSFAITFFMSRFFWNWKKKNFCSQIHRRNLRSTS